MENAPVATKLHPVLAVSCLVVLILVLTIFTIQGINIAVAILTATAYMVGVGLFSGFTLRELLEAMIKKVAEVGDLYVLLMGIGFLVAGLVYSGAIPTLITYLMSFITPSICILLGFLLPAITAYFIGTSFGTAGTIGIIMVSLGLAVQANMALLAGAIVSGSHVGLFLSPLSDNFNTAASIAKVDTITMTKRAMYIAGPTLVICIVFYLVMGLWSGSTSGVASDSTAFKEELAGLFTIHPVALIPIVYVLVASLMKMPAIIALFSGGFLSLIVGTLLNGFSIWTGFVAVCSGFDITTVTGMPEDALLPEILTLCNRGGMNSMISLLVIILSAMCMAGLMVKLGVVEVIISSALKNVRNIFVLTVWNWIISVLTSITTSASAISIIMPYEMLEEKYEKMGYSKEDCAVMCNAVASPVMSITPWTDVGVYMSGVVGVTTLSYAPYCIWGWGLGLVAILCSLFKIGFKKKKMKIPEELK